MKNKTKILLITIITISMLFLTGCTKTLTNEDKKVVKSPVTGQTLTENIVCQPTDKNIIKLYEENNVDITKLPKCSSFKATSGGYEGLWDSIFIKPLAFSILWISKYVKSTAIALIIISIIIRLITYPLTNKTAMQSELMKKAQPEIEKIEKKFADKTGQEVMMQKSQEMTAVYKKYKINPISGCIYALIQFPLFIAFLEAINRVPAIFEEKFLTLQMGTTPLVAIQNGQWQYLILVVLIGVGTFFSFTMNKTSVSSDQGMKNLPYIMVIMFVIFAFFMSSALGIYWITTNLFTIIQNTIVKRSKMLNEKA